MKECIAQALSKLIETKPLSEIKITELTRIAGVSQFDLTKENVRSSIFSIR